MKSTIVVPNMGESHQKPSHQEINMNAKKEEKTPQSFKDIDNSTINSRMSKKQFLQDILAPKKEAEAATQSPPSTKKKAAAPSVQQKTPEIKKRRETRKKMSNIRTVIAKRLLDVQHETAMLTTFNEIDMSAVISLRNKYKESFSKQHGTKLGFMSFFVMATVSALKAFPILNSYIDNDEIVQREYYDIGISVATDRGLIVPVLRNSDSMSFYDVEHAIIAFADKSRDATLSVDDVQGGGFTITNGGIYGSMLSTPILNPPQSGILGMHSITKRPVVVDDDIVIRPMMNVALTYDHRLIDGKDAVSFLTNIKDAVEDPARLLLNI